ncbi:MAG: biotin carboxylase N-terminal domain-containing protein [Prolixibacteraceae bacterium]
MGKVINAIKNKHLTSFNKILIANRGEIAVRIIQAAKLSGIHTVAIYAADDSESLHVWMADEAVLLPGKNLNETYLNQNHIIKIAVEKQADAIHPGYGFLSENAGFAKKVADAGLIFIGPSPENIRLMGEKNQALDYVRTLNIPVLPSFRGTVGELAGQINELEFPVMVKASGGGGGKGMVICNSPEELLPALEKAERQAFDYFGNGELFVEKYLPRARHIEVQLMADHHGNVLHFFERECSVQRRFQKIIEEAPSPSVDEKLRAELTSAAVHIARSMNYRNAGTVEFLLGESGKFYFLEMNTRIQVEHPVTEMITNSDLVSLQIQVAAGNELEIKQEDLKISGHAIEVRLCAEDAENTFKPSAGHLQLWRVPEQDNLRIETFVHEGIQVSPNYDSLIAKFIVWGRNREQALDKMQLVLSNTTLSGVHSNLPFLSGLIENEVIRKNEIYTRYVDEHLAILNQQIQERKKLIDQNHLVIAYLITHFYQPNHSGRSVWNQIGFWRITNAFEVTADGQKFTGKISGTSTNQEFTVNNQNFRVSDIQMNGNQLLMNINQHSVRYYCVDNKTETLVLVGGFSFALRSNLVLSQVSVHNKNVAASNVFQNLICADLFGKVLKLNYREGDLVPAGQILLTLESMKTEIHVLCPVDAKVKKMHVKAGNAVIEKQLLVEMEAPSNSPNRGEIEEVMALKS